MAAKAKQTEFVPAGVISADEFKEMQGTQFGGDLKVLKLEVGEGVKLRYVGNKVINTELGEATSHMAEDSDGNMISLPLATIFQNNLQLANIQVGQEFAILRLANVIGKKGVAKGKEMESYAIKKLS